jgi:CheY-like chemotaxis protein
MSDTRTVLIVDDDRDFVESNKDLLEAYGYRVIAAHDGASGLEMATQTEGFEIARKIPETPELKGLPVLLVTGVTKDLHLPFHFEPDVSWLPVERVLEKPIAPARLLAEIQKILGNTH